MREDHIGGREDRLLANMYIQQKSLQKAKVCQEQILIFGQHLDNRLIKWKYKMYLKHVTVLYKHLERPPDFLIYEISYYVEKIDFIKYSFVDLKYRLTWQQNFGHILREQKMIFNKNLTLIYKIAGDSKL